MIRGFKEITNASVLFIKQKYVSLLNIIADDLEDKEYHTNYENKKSGNFDPQNLVVQKISWLLQASIDICVTCDTVVFIRLSHTAR